jgi:tetratricopeptide (TPR) repeat protein
MCIDSKRAVKSFQQRKHAVPVIRSGLMLLLSTLVLLSSCQKSTTPKSETALEPGSPALEQLYQEGRAAYQASHFIEAAAMFERVVEVDPQHLHALINWGAALSSGNKPEVALPIFQQALSRDPNNVAALYNLGVAYQRLGQHAEAIEQYDRAVALNQAMLTPALQRYLQRQRPKLQETQINVPSPPPPSR